MDNIVAPPLQANDALDDIGDAQDLAANEAKAKGGTQEDIFGSLEDIPYVDGW